MVRMVMQVHGIVLTSRQETDAATEYYRHLPRRSMIHVPSISVLTRCRVAIASPLSPRSPRPRPPRYPAAGCSFDHPPRGGGLRIVAGDQRLPAARRRQSDTSKESRGIDSPQPRAFRYASLRVQQRKKASSLQLRRQATSVPRPHAAKSAAGQCPRRQRPVESARDRSPTRRAEATAISAQSPLWARLNCRPLSRQGESSSRFPLRTVVERQAGRRYVRGGAPSTAAVPRGCG